MSDAEPEEAAAPNLRAAITCPRCGHRETELMPTDACQYFYDCKGCSAVLKPKAGDCCVFCSYADVKCPPMQTGDCRASPSPPVGEGGRARRARPDEG